MTDDRILTEADVVTKLSHQPVHDTVAKLTAMISAKGMRLFAVIDQAAEARQAGLTLRETTLVVFGSPAAGTPVMAASPARNIAAALRAYNPSSRYVDAVLRYARWLRHEPGGLAGYYHRQVICHLTQWMGQAASRVRHQPRRAAHRAGPLTPR